MVQLSHPYTTTGKTMALTRWTFVGKVMSLLFNMLSRLVILEHHYMCQTERWSKVRTEEKGIQLGSVARDGDDIWAKTKWHEKQATQKKGPCKENSQRPRVRGRTSWGVFQEDGGGSWCKLLWSFGGYRVRPPHSLSSRIHRVWVMSSLREGEHPDREAHGSDTHAHSGTRGSTCEQAGSLGDWFVSVITMQYSGKTRFWSQLLISE